MLANKNAESNNTNIINPCFDKNDADNVIEIRTDETYPILSVRNDEHFYTSSGASDLASYQSSINIIIKPNSSFGHLPYVTIIIVELLGICSIILTACWMVSFDNKVGWDGSINELNWHPILMVVAMFTYVNAALTSYVLRGHTETFTHYIHCFALLLTFLFATIGMVSAWSVDTKRKYLSFHSWIGTLTVVFFLIQAIVGFTALFPKFKRITKKNYLKIQIWICSIILVLATTSCLIGNTEKILQQIQNLGTSTIYENILANILSLILLFFTGLSCTVLLHPAYRKP